MSSGYKRREKPNKENARKVWFFFPKIQFYLLTCRLDRDRKIELVWNGIKIGGFRETPCAHEGKKCGEIIQGRLEFTIGNQTRLLKEGDS